MDPLGDARTRSAAGPPHGAPRGRRYHPGGDRSRFPRGSPSWSTRGTVVSFEQVKDRCASRTRGLRVPAIRDIPCFSLYCMYVLLQAPSAGLALLFSCLVLLCMPLRLVGRRGGRVPKYMATHQPTFFGWWPPLACVYWQVQYKNYRIYFSMYVDRSDDGCTSLIWCPVFKELILEIVCPSSRV